MPDWACWNLGSKPLQVIAATTRAVIPCAVSSAVTVRSALQATSKPMHFSSFAWLLQSGRRRSGEKYAGLRVLR